MVAGELLGEFAKPGGDRFQGAVRRKGDDEDEESAEDGVVVAAELGLLRKNVQ